MDSSSGWSVPPWPPLCPFEVNDEWIRIVRMRREFTQAMDLVAMRQGVEMSREWVAAIRILTSCPDLWIEGVQSRLLADGHSSTWPAVMPAFVGRDFYDYRAVEAAAMHPVHEWADICVALGPLRREAAMQAISYLVGARTQPW